MRLAPQELAAIKTIVRGIDEKAKIYLFGSRVDDSLRGGDIDLLVVSDRISLMDKVLLLDQMKNALGDQKIDVVLKNPGEFASDPFVTKIIKSAVLI